MPHNKESNKNSMNKIGNENKSQTNIFIKKNMTKKENLKIIIKNKSTNVKIVHWNANSLNNKINEFKSLILQATEPDIVSINETKMSEFRANMLLNFNNYNVIHKARYENTNGAGCYISPQKTELSSY
jgi:hypothetical protein